MTNKRPFNDEFNMITSNIDLRKQFLTYLSQPESCELFYIYMKTEHLTYVLEFYLACDGLKNIPDDKKNQGDIIELIYKHYLSTGKCLSSSRKFPLTNDLLFSIKQRLIKQEFHSKFYEQAQEYVLKYMLQMCYPKFLIEQQNSSKTKRQAISTSTFTPMYRRCMTSGRKQSTTLVNLNATVPETQSLFNPRSLDGSTLISDNEVGLNSSKQPRTIKLTKQEKDQYSLAQRNPSAFFAAIKSRLLAYQAEICEFNIYRKTRMIDDDPSVILDLQIAKIIDDADNCTFETMKQSNSFTRSDSGVGTDISEKNSKIFRSSHKQHSFIDVIWYPSLDTAKALLSTIPYIHNQLTFKEFRQLFKKQTMYRYFFKTICTPDINQEQYVFRELTMDDELVPFYNGKIFVQLDRIC